MEKTVTINGKSIKVINTTDQTPYISDSDAEMDLRASYAIKVAIDKAIICKKPIARYDKLTKRAYLEYPNGERKYTN